jgi:hypothetical protein
MKTPREILTDKWGKPQMDDTSYPNQYLKNTALEAMQEYAERYKAQLIAKQEELIELLYLYHDAHTSSIKLNYADWRNKLTVLQTEIKMLKNES